MLFQKYTLMRLQRRENSSEGNNNGRTREGRRYVTVGISTTASENYDFRIRTDTICNTYHLLDAALNKDNF